MSDKVFVGSGKAGKYGIKIKIKREQLEAVGLNKYGEFMLEVKERKEPGKYGETHYVCRDDWAYEHQNDARPETQSEPEREPEKSDLPF